MYVNSSWKRTRCNIPPQLIRKSKSSRIESFHEFLNTLTILVMKNIFSLAIRKNILKAYLENGS
jgi:hypothetical protein